MRPRATFWQLRGSAMQAPGCRVQRRSRRRQRRSPAPHTMPAAGMCLMTGAHDVRRPAQKDGLLICSGRHGKIPANGGALEASGNALMPLPSRLYRNQISDLPPEPKGWQRQARRSRPRAAAATGSRQWGTLTAPAGMLCPARPPAALPGLRHVSTVNAYPFAVSSRPAAATAAACSTAAAHGLAAADGRCQQQRSDFEQRSCAVVELTQGGHC